MPLLIAFVLFFAWGWWRARKAGGGVADRVRYGLIHGLAVALVLYAVATLGDWQGLTN
ncbi:hypothetical protein P2H44_04735 [Albimonas sp. CAU 1670]|uniref:hypothetical protein n=1 Tax=Albimonas sp. CAU 1670 TaxID=3032599 RepID=UPI0023DB49AE|nr:hypothetical protein [Albimonas sp. CAU 1670]MDF2231851.1 hypothetical protein [Albimonas sp. CAU 1670]